MLQVKKPSPEEVAIMEAVIDKGDRHAMVLILHAALKEARWPYRLFSKMVKESLVGWALIDFIRIMHGGNIKAAILDLERQYFLAREQAQIERRN